MKLYLLMYLNFILFSLSAVAARYAGFYPLFSFPALGLYLLSFVMLFVYALLWQQVLKKLPLTVAFINKAATIPLGMIWGFMLFEEVINLYMIIGVLIIIGGAILMIKGERYD